MKKLKLGTRCVRFALAFGLCVIATSAYPLGQREIGEILHRGTVKVAVYDGQNLVGHGSGFILTGDGFVGTNYHVIQAAVDRGYRLVVESADGDRKSEAEAHNWHFIRDFAVLKMKDAAGWSLAPIALGNSSSLRPLDAIYVAGFPVTGVYKVQRGEFNSLQSFGGVKALDISVLIDRGNSGGPVVDENGTLIGVSVAYMKQARSMNLAIRSNDIRDTIQAATAGKRKILVRDGRERERNNTMDESNLIVSGMTVTGSLGAGDDADWFEVNRQEGFRPTVELSRAAGGDFALEVYSDSFLTGKTAGKGPVEGITCNVPGRCFLKVLRKGGSGDYTLRIRPAARSETGGSELEINDRREIANPVTGTVIRGRTGGQDAGDWFVLGGQEGTRPTLTISHDASCNIDFEVYSDDTLVGRAAGAQSPETVTCSVPGRCYIRVWSARGEGDYTINLDPRGGTDDEREPNNDRTAATLVRSMAFRGELNASDTEDWFELNGQEGVFPTFAISHAGGANFDFEVFSGEVSVGRAVGTGQSDTLTARVPGRCFVRVWRVSGQGAYTVTVRTPVRRTPSVDGREIEPNNDRQGATLTQSMILLGGLDERDGEDWFELAGQEGTRPTFTIMHGSDANFDVEVYSGDELAGRALGAGASDRVSCTVPGRCFVRVIRVSGSGSYSVSIERRMPNATGREEEPNNTQATATLTSSMVVSGKLDANDHTDWFELGGQEGTQPSFTLASDPGCVFDMRVFSGESEVCHIISGSAPVTSRCAVPGRCFVRLWRIQGDGNYTVSISR